MRRHVRQSRPLTLSSISAVAFLLTPPTDRDSRFLRFVSPHRRYDALPPFIAMVGGREGLLQEALARSRGTAAQASTRLLHHVAQRQHGRSRR